MEQFDRHTRCLLCESDKIEQMKGYERHYLSKCRNCGFVFAHRIPSQNELILHYNQYPRLNNIAELSRKRFQEIISKFEPLRKTNRMLDVGCGDGFFLEEAKKLGWEVYGTEFTDDAIAICEEKGINMYQGDITTAPYPENYFDVIVSIEVIEHINNPNDFIGQIKKFLRPGGVTYMTTPNFNSLLRYKLKADYNVIEYPEHLSYYTSATIKKLMKRNGMKKDFVKTTGISIGRLRARKKSKTVTVTNTEAKTAENSSTHGAVDQHLRHKIESRWHLRMAKSAINFWLNTFKVGDSLKFQFRKPLA